MWIIFAIEVSIYETLQDDGVGPKWKNSANDVSELKL